MTKLLWLNGLGEYDLDSAGGLKPLTMTHDLSDHRDAEQERQYRAVRWRRFIAKIRMRHMRNWRRIARIK